MDVSGLTSATIPAIVGICAIVGYCIKNIFEDADRLHDFIPTISCLLGTALAVGNAYMLGDAINIDVIFMGMASGLAATGTYEMLTHWKDTTPQGAHIEEK